jgi:anti-anti-sigma factor
MNYQFERTGTTAIFILQGRIDSVGSIDLDKATKERLVPADTAVLFDMTGVTYMSSAGIRVFSNVERILRQRNGHLYLCSVQPAVLKVIALTGFDRIFSICATRDEALSRSSLATIPQEPAGNPTAPATSHARLSADAFPGPGAILKLTGMGNKLCAGQPGPDDLVPRPFVPEEYSAGVGVPGDSVIESFPDRGALVTLGGAIFWRPQDNSDPPEFLIPKTDAPRVLLNTAFSVAVDGPFHEIIVAEPVRPEGMSIRDLFSDILRHAKTTRNNHLPVMSVVMYTGTRDADLIMPTPAQEDRRGRALLPADRTLVSFGTCIDTSADLSAYDRDALDEILCQNGPGSDTAGMSLYQYGLVFDAPPTLTSRDITRLIATTAAQEPCTDLVRLSPETLLSRALIGIHYIAGIEHTDRMPVRIRGECPGWNKTYETITRWLHPGCRDLELTPLSGGFSGTLVFRVNARDGRGRLMMPLVMKLGSWPLIEAEIFGYTDHVKRYIQNNATQIIETERVGEFGGILYNFVGIRGTESSIFSLEDFYLSRDPDQILPVFDALFRVVLQGWYGEPKKKEIALYQDYNRFWKYDNILTYAAEHFGATPDMEEIELPFGLGKSANPLYFVEKVMTDRLSQTFSVYESSVHGDLNMKNVLMDETTNLWLIDFAETRYSHILRDIVKLEAVIKGEMVPLDSRDTLADLVRMDVPFLSARALSEIPELQDTRGNPELEKAFRVVQSLRQQADRITPGDDDIAQYYLGLLPYTLNLLSYSSVNAYQKEYGWIASSLICQRLMEPGR